MPNWERYYGSDLTDPLDVSRLEQFEKLTDSTTLVWEDGLSLRLVPGEQLSRALHVSGTYEPNTLCALRSHLEPGSVFMDVGAHAGVMSLAASRWVGPRGHVYSFEPSEREHHRLLESLDLSRATNVTPVRAAVGARGGRGNLRIADAPNSGLNTLGDRFAYRGVVESSLENVEVVTVDEYVRERGIPRVDAIKLDIEGGEVAALAGATQVMHRFRPALVIELNAAALEACGTTPSRLEELLSTADYRAFAIAESNADLMPVAAIGECHGQNLVFLPRESAGNLL